MDGFDADFHCNISLWTKTFIMSSFGILYHSYSQKDDG